MRLCHTLIVDRRVAEMHVLPIFKVLKANILSPIVKVCLKYCQSFLQIRLIKSVAARLVLNLHANLLLDKVERPVLASSCEVLFQSRRCWWALPISFLADGQIYKILAFLAVQVFRRSGDRSQKLQWRPWEALRLSRTSPDSHRYALKQNLRPFVIKLV